MGLMRSRYWLLLATLLAVLYAGCRSGTSLRLQPLPADAVVLAFGDSLTRGTGSSIENGYPQQLQTRIRRQVVNAGVPGELSRQGALRLPEVLRQVQPALVVLCHGGNDLLRGVDGAETQRSLRRMLEAIRAAGAEAVVLGVPSPRAWLRVPAFYRDLAREFAAVYEGDILPQVLGDGSLKSDPIHPNAAGYRRIAVRLYQLLLERGALPEQG